MFCDVSTLPATTAAGYFGFNMQSSGITSVMGFRQPAFKGMSSSTRVRKTYNTADLQTAVGALKFVSNWAEVPVKSILAVRSA